MQCGKILAKFKTFSMLLKRLDVPIWHVGHPLN